MKAGRGDYFWLGNKKGCVGIFPVCSNRRWVVMSEAMVEREGEGCVLRLVDWEDGIAVWGFNGNVLRLAWLRWLLLSECFLCQWW